MHLNIADKFLYILSSEINTCTIAKFIYKLRCSMQKRRGKGWYIYLTCMREGVRNRFCPSVCAVCPAKNVEMGTFIRLKNCYTRQ